VGVESLVEDTISCVPALPASPSELLGPSSDPVVVKFSFVENIISSALRSKTAAVAVLAICYFALLV
jgi:hypothetical protein